MVKRITAEFYTRGKFGKRLRETLDTGNPFLYSKGRYPTKITSEDLPEDYIEIHSRSIWYMTGYLKTSGIVDIGYTWIKENHLFKDDYIYISYKEKLRIEPDEGGSKDTQTMMSASAATTLSISFWPQKSIPTVTRPLRDPK